MKYIPVDKLISLIDAKLEDLGLSGSVWVGRSVLQDLKNDIIASLQQETPDKDTIIRICKLHKVWSIAAPWENIEDFVTANWNSKNID